MIKKKAKGKTSKTTKAKKSSGRRVKKELNPTEVRQDISRIVKSHANSMTEAVIGEGEKGQLATVKYLFEMAEIYPASTDGSHATEDEDCLARTLLNRLDLPTEPVGRDEEDEPLKVSKPAMATGKHASEKESDKQNTERKNLEPETGTGGGDSTNVSLTGINNTVE